MLLYSETSNITTHTLKVAVVDTRGCEEGFTFSYFTDLVRRALPALDPLNFQLVDIPFKLHHPMWAEHAHVDVGRHVKRVALAPPGGRVALNRLIGDIATEQLPRDRPLWEITFVEGLAPNKTVIVAKVHHALADGVASANLLALAMDSTRMSERPKPVVPARSDTRTLLRAAARDHLEHLAKLPALIRDTVAGVRSVRRHAASRDPHPEMAQLFAPPRTFINRRVAPGRGFVTASVSLADAKEVKDRLGITLNDLFLAISAGALRALIERYDGRAERAIIASVPVNTDPSPHRVSGNALGALFVSLPVHVDDPVERCRLVAHATNRAKENNRLLGPELIGRWVDYLPPPLAPLAFRWMARRDRKNNLYNLSISNVRGPSEEGVIGCAPMAEFYSVGPLTAGSAMNITAWSYVDQLNITVLADDQSTDSIDEVSGALLASFYEIRRAIGISEEPRIPDTAMSEVGDQQ